MFGTSQKTQQKKKNLPNNQEAGFEKQKKREYIRPPENFSELPGYLKDIAKQEIQEVTDAFWVQLIGVDSAAEKQKEMEKQTEKHNAQNYSPLDFLGLTKKQEKHSAQELEALRKRFHDMVQSGTQKAIDQRKKEEEERKKAMEEEEERKKQEEEERKAQEQQQMEEPQGKQKGQLGQPRKKASVSETQFETKNSKKG